MQTFCACSERSWDKKFCRYALQCIRLYDRIYVMKKLLSLICSICLIAVAAFSLSACAGEASVNYTLSEDGTHYIVSGVSGNRGSFVSCEIPSEYSAEEGGTLLPVTEIGDEAFMRCYSLSFVTLPDTIEKIGMRAFGDCGFRNFTIPESVTSIGYAAFGRCTSLTEIVIPQSVTEIGELAFAYCNSLQTVVLKANVTELKIKTFANSYKMNAGELYTNTSLKAVYLPATLKKIYRDALDGNIIDDIYFAGSEAEWDELYFYEKVKKEGTENEYVEKRVEKSALLGANVNMHFNAQYPAD